MHYHMRFIYQKYLCLECALSLLTIFVWTSRNMGFIIDYLFIYLYNENVKKRVVKWNKIHISFAGAGGNIKYDILNNFCFPYVQSLSYLKIDYVITNFIPPTCIGMVYYTSLEGQTWQLHFFFYRRWWWGHLSSEAIIKLKTESYLLLFIHQHQHNCSKKKKRKVNLVVIPQGQGHLYNQFTHC